MPQETAAKGLRDWRQNKGADCQQLSPVGMHAGGDSVPGFALGRALLPHVERPAAWCRLLRAAAFLIDHVSHPNFMLP